MAKAAHTLATHGQSKTPSPNGKRPLTWPDAPSLPGRQSRWLPFRQTTWASCLSRRSAVHTTCSHTACSAERPPLLWLEYEARDEPRNIASVGFRPSPVAGTRSGPRTKGGRAPTLRQRVRFGEAAKHPAATGCQRLVTERAPVTPSTRSSAVRTDGLLTVERPPSGTGQDSPDLGSVIRLAGSRSVRPRNTHELNDSPTVVPSLRVLNHFHRIL